MPSLFYTFDGVSLGAVFQKRVLLGSKPFNGVQLEDNTVSRIHAWIDQDGDLFYISDASSRTGTTVNRQSTKGRVILSDGDEIDIGPFCITFSTSDELPEDAMTFEIADNGTNPDFPYEGYLSQCECGAPVWAPRDMAGAQGYCRVCHGPVTIGRVVRSESGRPLVPNHKDAALAYAEQPAVKGPAHPRPESRQRTCAGCQRAVAADQEAVECSSCRQTYHAACWDNHGGCGAYGCEQNPNTALAEAASVESH